jgi:hexosaminidase
MDATLNFDSSIDIESIQVSTFNSPGQWIYPPKSINVWVKTITKDEFEKVDIQEKLDNVKHKIHSQELMLNKKDVVAIRVLAMDHGVIAEGNQGAGNRAWLFIDEIVVR